VKDPDLTEGKADTRPDAVIPVLEEKLEVRKRRTRKGVRVRKSVQERAVTVDEPEVHQEVEVTRVPVGRVVDGPMDSYAEGDTTVIPVVEEEIVVQKRWVLREEVRIAKRGVTRHAPKRVVLRSESAHIEPLDD
jgi:uncharacterized protein (TIGR02271 family)